MKKHLVAGALALAVAGSGASAIGATSAKMPELRFDVTPKAVTHVGADPIGAGFHRMTLVNKGRPGAAVALVRLDAGVTPEQFAAAVPSFGDPTEVAKYGRIVASTFWSGPSPYTTTLRFDDADYVFVDLSKKPAARLGFHAGPQPDDGGVRLPAPDAEVQLRDYRFAMPSKLPAGRSVIRTTNAGDHLHHALVVPLKAGVSSKRVLRDVRKGKEPNYAVAGPPSALVEAVSPHATNDVEVDLRKGRYLFVCFMQDSATSKPHAMLGMEKIVRVR